MGGRERILKAINFQEADRVPLDIGGADSCGITLTAYENLLDYLGISVPQKAEVNKAGGKRIKVDEVVFQKLGVDVRPLNLNKPSSWELKLYEDEKYIWFWNEWGKKLMMPKVNGINFSSTEYPLEKKDFEDYQWPDPADESRFKGLLEKARDIRENIGAAVVTNSLGSILFQMGARLHGYSRWLMMLASEPARVEKFLDQALEFEIRYWDAFLNHVNGFVDVVCLGDDLGTQTSTWISKEMYRKYIKPRQTKLFSMIKKKADVKIYLHSCGSVYDFIPDFIEAGVDILNFQISAAHMDTKRLKREFGKDLVFWGGGVDTHKVLPFGTPQEVKEEVKRRIDDLAPGGGFVFAAVHAIQPEVPPENIVAMLEALDRYGKY